MRNASSAGEDVRGATEDADREALERVAAGELDALEELYDRYKSLVYAVALRVTGDAGLAEDAVQETFLGAWRNAARFDRAKASVKTWLVSIVHHRSVDLVRRRRPTTELPSAEGARGMLSVPDVWGEVAGRLDADEVRSALGTLPPAQRVVIELAYLDGLTQQQIAQRTGAPLGTVKGRMRLGLLGLRRVLTGDVERTGPVSADESKWVTR